MNESEWQQTPMHYTISVQTAQAMKNLPSNTPCDFSRVSALVGIGVDEVCDIGPEQLQHKALVDPVWTLDFERVLLCHEILKISPF